MRTNSGLRAAVVLTVFGILFLISLSIAGWSQRFLLILFIIIAILSPMGLRYVAGRLDLFEPLVLSNIALGVMFIARPLGDIALGMPVHLGWPISYTFDEALIVVLVGIVFFQIGYHSSLAQAWARRLRRPPPFRPQLAKIAAWVFFGLGGLLFGLFLAQSGGLGVLFELLEGRSTGNNATFLGSTGYFYNGILMWIASALIFFALANASKRRHQYFSFFLTVLPLLIFFGARGTRSQLLPLLLAVPTFWYLWHNQRPSVRTLLIAALIGVALLGWQRETRHVDAERDGMVVLLEALISPLDQMHEIINGADNEMFDSIANALYIVPEYLDHRPLGTVADFFIRAIPRPLWPNKPLETNDAMINALWPEHYQNSRASAAFSVIGPFYMDSGYIGVAVGMFLIGVFFSVTWYWYKLYNRNIVAVMIYSITLPFCIILMRGNLPDTASRMLFIVVPLLVLSWVSRLGSGRLSTRFRRRGGYYIGR